MSISAAMVKELRERTGSGMMECKKALVEANGDMDLAIENMLHNREVDMSDAMPNARAIFARMKDLYARGEKIDRLTVAKNGAKGKGTKLAAKPADGLPGLGRGFARNRAGVDDQNAGEAGRRGFATDHLRLVGVEPAAEGDDVDGHVAPGLAATASVNSAGLKRPSNSNSAGPVIST